MYLPSLYRSEDLNFLKNLIGENPLGSLITFKEKVLCTKAIIQINELTKDLFVLETHLNKVNPIAKSLNVGDEILCDFLGVHSYISSS